MTFEDLERLLGTPIENAPNAEILAVTEDSRAVTPGALFVAAQGTHVDGHDFAAQAKASGAVAIIGEREGLDELARLPYIRVPHSRRALGLVAHELAGHPSRAMNVIGVTGTNGKTSTVFLLQRILDACGCRCAAFGTLGYAMGGETLASSHTTAFGEELARAFRQAREAGHSHVAMEVSSHALEQERVAGIDFDVAVFTNLTQDHLDYHGDMERYLDAKIKLFERVEGPGRFTVVNRGDPRADRLIQASRAPCYTFGEGGHCRAADVKFEADRTTFRLHSPWGPAAIEMHLVGTHNVANALGAIAVCGGLGLPIGRIAEGIASLPTVPGRFEQIDAGQPFRVIVDYAHTEDGLKNVLEASREISSGRIIAVFGCGGDRDKTKRPKMAATVAQRADFAIITSDNPRTEDPERILLDIEMGIQHAGKKKDDDYLVILDRAEAIERAIALAKPGDLVLIAGKGHEDYQILGTRRIHFDDREIARQILEAT